MVVCVAAVLLRETRREQRLVIGQNGRTRRRPVISLQEVAAPHIMAQASQARPLRGEQLVLLQ